MNDKRIFRANEIDTNRNGWIVDLSPADVVNPDCYWTFKSRKAAKQFAALVDGGMDAREAVNEIEHRPSGTAPDTSLCLGDERRAWLVQQGGIQPTIKRLVDEAMKS